MTMTIGRALPAGVELSAFDVIDSTSDEARRQAERGHKGPLWVMAQSQTAGRGRRGRAWISKPGNFYASVLLRPRLTAADAGRLSFVASLALARTLTPLVPSPHRLALKWPNDALVDGAKIAGILLESQSGPDGYIAWLTIGIGVNLAHAPQGTETPALALADLGVHVQPMEFITPLAHHMADLLAQFSTHGFAPIHAAWVDLAAGIGQPIQVRLADKTLKGIFTGLDPNGALVLDQGDGIVRIAAGEVFLNPAQLSPA